MAQNSNVLEGLELERRSLGRPSVSRRRRGPPSMSLSMSLPTGNVVATIAAGAKGKAAPAKVELERPTVNRLLLRNPKAVLALVPKELYMLLAGGIAGAIAKSTTAPLDRVKIIMQISSVNQQSAAAQAAAKNGLVSAFLTIGRTEGIGGYWRGNLPQVLRVLPYSACQLYSYEKLKKMLADKDGNLSVPARLAAGAGAACISTTLTYPLDIIRFRMAVDPTLNTIPQVIRAVIRDEGMGAFYKGLIPSCIGIAPYASINFASFDLLKKALPEDLAGNSTAVFCCSLAAAAVATGGCYPLDTIRRQMQLKSSTYKNVFEAVSGIVGRDGVGGLYRGFLPNAAKNLPNSSIRLSTFDFAKKARLEAADALEVETAALAAEKKAAEAKAAAEAKNNKNKKPVGAKK